MFTRDSITYAIKVLYVSATCDSGTNVQITIRVTFRTNLPSDLVIEQMLQGAIDNNIANLTITGQTVTFQGMFNIVVISKMQNKLNQIKITPTWSVQKVPTHELCQDSFFAITLKPKNKPH